MLADPKISWFVKKPADAEYKQSADFYAGSYNKEADLIIDFVIWNNKFGTEKVKDLSSFGIVVGFDEVEDSTLLKYCSFELNEKEIIKASIDGVSATIPMPPGFSLSGAVNDGSDKFTDNYLALKVLLSIPAGTKVKANDLKTMSFDVVEL